MLLPLTSAAPKCSSGQPPAARSSRHRIQHGYWFAKHMRGLDQTRVLHPVQAGCVVQPRCWFACQSHLGDGRAWTRPAAPSSCAERVLQLMACAPGCFVPICGLAPQQHRPRCNPPAVWSHSTVIAARTATCGVRRREPWWRCAAPKASGVVERLLLIPRLDGEAEGALN